MVADFTSSTADSTSANLARTSDHVPVMLNFSTSKSVAPTGNIAAGGVLRYAIIYENIGVTSTTNVIITDAIPNNTTFLSAQDGGVHISANDIVSWTVGVVPLGDSRTVHFRVRVDKPLTSGIFITNVAYIRSDQISTTETNATTNTVVDILPDFGLSYKQATPDGNSVQPGDFITYTIVYTNGGTDMASDVIIADCIPAHTTITGGEKTPCIEFDDIGNIGVAEGGSVSFPIRVNLDAPGGAVISNFATIDSNQTPPMNTDPVTRTVMAPNLTLHKAVMPTGTTQPGDKLTFTLTYTNSGNVQATGVTITDILPIGLSCPSSSGDGEMLSWDIQDLAISESGQITFTAWVTGGVTAVHNQAYLNSDQRASQSSEVVITPIQTPILQVRKTASPSGQMPHGSLLTYTLHYTNTGSIHATGTVILDPLDDNAEYDSSDDCNYSPSSHSVSCSLGTVSPGSSDSVTFTVQVSGTLGSTIQNTVQIFCEQLYPAAYVNHDPIDVPGSQPYTSIGGSGTFDYFAQSFIATAPLLKRAGIHIFGNTEPYPDLRVELWGDTDGNPDPNKAFPIKTLITNLTSEGERYYIVPCYPINLTVGARYWLVINGTIDATSGGSAGTRYAEDNPYDAGRWVRSNDAGGNWTVWDNMTDLNVHIEYVPPPQSNAVTTTTGVEISGPTGGMPGIPYTFIAAASQGTITTPLTYTWKATGQNDTTRPGGVSDTISYTWDKLGDQTIIVTVTGGENPITGTHTITISQPKNIYLPVIVRCWALPGSLDISGPTTGISGTNYTFNASFKAMRPVDYVWQATGPVTQSGIVTEPTDCSYDPIIRTAVFSWTISGTKTITFTATSGGIPISESYNIAICDSIPQPPDISDIENSDINGDYDVCWSTRGPDSIYYLEEAANSAFTSDTKVYSTTNTCYSFNNKGAQEYYYRVRVCNSMGCCSDWSNVKQVKPWYEREPNNSCVQANGPVVSGLIYYSALPDGDKSDYFYFDLDTTHRVDIWLTNIPSQNDYDLYLYRPCENLWAKSDRYGNVDEHIPQTGILELEAGRYYVRVYNYSDSGSIQPYHLQVVYQQTE